MKTAPTPQTAADMVNAILGWNKGAEITFRDSDIAEDRIMRRVFLGVADELLVSYVVNRKDELQEVLFPTLWLN